METTVSDNRVVKMRFDGTRLSGYTPPILTGIVRDTQLNGGKIAFGPDGYLYVATGDARKRNLAQDKKSLNGKILRITKSGAAAPRKPVRNPCLQLWSPQSPGSGLGPRRAVVVDRGR